MWPSTSRIANIASSVSTLPVLYYSEEYLQSDSHGIFQYQMSAQRGTAIIQAVTARMVTAKTIIVICQTAEIFGSSIPAQSLPYRSVENVSAANFSYARRMTVILTILLANVSFFPMIDYDESRRQADPNRGPAPAPRNQPPVKVVPVADVEDKLVHLNEGLDIQVRKLNEIWEYLHRRL